MCCVKREVVDCKGGKWARNSGGEEGNDKLISDFRYVCRGVVGKASLYVIENGGEIEHSTVIGVELTGGWRGVDIVSPEIRVAKGKNTCWIEYSNFDRVVGVHISSIAEGSTVRVCCS